MYVCVCVKYICITNHVPLMLSSTQMFRHLVLSNHSTTLADYSTVSFMRHVLKYSSAVLIISI